MSTGRARRRHGGAVRPILMTLTIICSLIYQPGRVRAQKVGINITGSVGAGANPYSSVDASGGGGEVIAGASLGFVPFENQMFELMFQFRSYERGYIVVEQGKTADAEEVLRESMLNISLMADIWKFELGQVTVRPYGGLSFFMFENDKVPSSAGGPAVGVRLDVSLPRGMGIELRTFAMLNVIQKGEEDLTSTGGGGTRRTSPYHGVVSWGGLTAQPAFWWRPPNSRFGVGLSYGIQLFGMSGGELRMHHGATGMLEYRFSGSAAAAEVKPGATVAEKPTTAQPTAPPPDDGCAEELKLEQQRVAGLKQATRIYEEDWSRELKKATNCKVKGSTLSCSACKAAPGKNCPACQTCKECPRPTARKCPACAGVPKAKVRQLMDRIRQEINKVGPYNTKVIRKNIVNLVNKGKRL